MAVSRKTPICPKYPPFAFRRTNPPRYAHVVTLRTRKTTAFDAFPPQSRCASQVGPNRPRWLSHPFKGRAPGRATPPHTTIYRFPSGPLLEVAPWRPNRRACFGGPPRTRIAGSVAAAPHYGAFPRLVGIEKNRAYGLPARAYFGDFGSVFPAGSGVALFAFSRPPH